MTAKTEHARPRFILEWAFGLYPMLHVNRHDGTYEYSGYVNRRGQTFVRWNRLPHSPSCVHSSEANPPEAKLLPASGAQLHGAAQ